MTGGFQTVPTIDPTTASTSFTTGSLFPFAITTSPATYTKNYTVWGGRCTAQEPPAPTDQFTVAPGSTGQAQTISEPLLDVNNVTFTNPSTGVTSAVIRPHLELKFASGGCTDNWYPTVSSASTLPATGWLANPGQPYAASGTLTVCADYGGYQKSVTTSNTSFTAMNVVPLIAITKNTGTGTCT